MRLGTVAAVWGVVGVCLLLTQAVVRLTPMAVEAMSSGQMGALEWAIAIGWVVFGLYAEAWRGFHQRFSPRVVARARHLARVGRPPWHHVLLAPAFCMAFFHATRRGLAVAWGVTGGVVVLVVLVRLLPQPWRGIVDLGVVVALALGVLSILWFSLEAFRGRELPIDPELPS